MQNNSRHKFTNILVMQTIIIIVIDITPMPMHKLTACMMVVGITLMENVPRNSDLSITESNLPIELQIPSQTYLWFYLYNISLLLLGSPSSGLGGLLRHERFRLTLFEPSQKHTCMRALKSNVIPKLDCFPVTFQEFCHNLPQSEE